jgi:UDP-N-acetylmuramoylalanine--D-glutamate ligase
MEAYVAAKARICRFQPPEAAAVLNFDCPETRGLQQSCPGRVYFFSMEHQVATGAYLKAGRIILVEENQPLQGWEGLPISAIPLRGSHNIANVMAALLLAYVNGIPPEYYEEAVRSFKAVPHRLEHVGSVGGVDYYNDSIATAPDRTVAALHSFSEPVVLIAGGYDKGLSFEPVARELVGSVARLILLGDTAEAIEEAVRQAAADTGGELPPVHHVSTLEEAVNTAAETAPAGSVVLLSPACASYDMFDNFEVRGDTFRRLVHSL